MSIDFIKGFCNYSIFGAEEKSENLGAIAKKEINLISSEKSFYEQEKDLLKSTLIDFIARGAILLTALPYVPSLEVQHQFKKQSAILFGLSFFLRQVALFGQNKIKKEIEKFENETDEAKELLKKKDITCFKDLLTASLPDLMGYKEALLLRQKGIDFINDFFPAVNLASSFKPIMTLVHEYGHYFAKRYFNNFKNNIIPIIELNETGGLTKLQDNDSDLSFLSYLLTLGGSMRSAFSALEPFSVNKVAITAAGPMTEIAFATSLITAAHFSSNSYLSHFLNIAACMTIVNDLEYASTAFTNIEKPSHDFAVLWDKAGIHPYASMACIVGLPLIAKSGLLLRDYYHLKSKEIIAPMPEPKEEVITPNS